MPFSFAIPALGTWLRLGALALMLVALGGCGFALRGSAQLPPELRTLYLEGLEQDSDMLREVRRALTNNRVELAEEPDMLYRLGIGREQRSERVVSVNVNARAGEYELTLALPWQLRQGDVTVAGPENLTLSRVYLADPENAVAKGQEAEQILREMRQDLSYQLLRRLQALPL
ncbi:MAG TPA: LPS assembly lipoprotein LptE [Hyphomicrobiales bacterium]|nr:LPS assembly lipoprotein LptE [Hyphomicrobiales bacterium]